jgi:RNA recognition motif-containing protein
MSCKILIGNLDVDADESSVRELVLPFLSHVVSFEVPLESKTGKNRGYAYLVLRTEEEARSAVSMLQGQNSSGRNISISIVETCAPAGKWYKFGFA